jgi:serine/threonine protein kinase
MEEITATWFFKQNREITVLKELGTGYYGTTFLVEIDGRKYALKRLKVTQKDIDIITGTTAGLTEVSNEVAVLGIVTKHSKMLQFYGYRIVKCNMEVERGTCSYKYRPTNSVFKRNDEELKKYNETPFIMEIVMEYIDGDVLQKIIYKAATREIKKWTFDIIEQLKILRLMGIVHNDVHFGNIMITKDRKRAVLVDYGYSLTKNILQVGENKQKWNYIWAYNSFSDMGSFLNTLSTTRDCFWFAGQKLKSKGRNQNEIWESAEMIIATSKYANKVCSIAGCMIHVDILNVFSLFFRLQVPLLLKSITGSKIPLYRPLLPISLLKALYLNRNKTIAVVKKLLS